MKDMSELFSNKRKPNRNSVIRRTLLVLISVLLLLSMGACGNLLQTLDTAAQSMPTPVPLVITPEPVITYTDAQTLPLPDGTEVPAGYSRIETEQPQIALFAFTDSAGTIQYRVYGGYNELVNGTQGEQFTGFYEADSTGAILSEDAKPVDPTTESFGTGLAQPLPETIRLRAVYQISDKNVITDGAGAYFILYKNWRGGRRIL